MLSRKPKEMIQSEVKLPSPDFSKPFHLYPDASNKQLSATLVQDGKLLGFCIRKLNDLQVYYTVGKRKYFELLKDSKALLE